MIFSQVHRFAELDSTNRKALELANQGAAEGTVVVARTQTSGHGRKGRAWHSPVGGLWMSVVLRPPQVEGLTLMASLAVVRTLAKFKVGALVRWPNDISVKGLKVAGVLAESRLLGQSVDHVVVGIGVNVNQTEFPEDIRDLATSLRLVTGRECDLHGFEQVLLHELDGLYHHYRATGPADCIRAVAELSELTGQRVAVETEEGTVEGVVRGLTATGGLELEGGQVFYTAERVRRAT